MLTIAPPGFLRSLLTDTLTRPIPMYVLVTTMRVTTTNGQVFRIGGEIFWDCRLPKIHPR